MENKELSKTKIMTKKCPTCKGEGQIKVDALGMTPEEIRREIECYEKMSGKDPF